MKDFELKLSLNAPQKRVYDAIASTNGPKNWWTTYCTVDEKVGGSAMFDFPKAEFFANMEISKLEAPHLVEWKCVDSKHAKSTGFSDLRDWVGTTIRFKIEPDGTDKSRLLFTHVGLNDRLECFDICQSGWAYYLNESLRQFVETGKGKPFTNDSYAE